MKNGITIKHWDGSEIPVGDYVYDETGSDQENGAIECLLWEVKTLRKVTSRMLELLSSRCELSADDIVFIVHGR